MFKFILTILSLTIFLTSCINLFDAPQMTLVKTASNLGRTKKAVLLQDAGNATVDRSLQVSIFNDDYTVSGKEIGNTFTVDRNHGATVLDAASINLSWLSNDTLQIDFDQKLKTFI